MQISLQKEAQRKDCALLLSNNFNGDLYCTVAYTPQAFEQFGTLYMTNIRSDRASNPVSGFEPHPHRMNRPGKMLQIQIIGGLIQLLDFISNLIKHLRLSLMNVFFPVWYIGKGSM